MAAFAIIAFMFKSVSYVCSNCNRHLMSDMKFCPTCGQRSDTHRLSIKHILHEFFHALTHADKSILILLQMLALRPGLVAREYVEGKRQKYFNPLNFFLICVAIFVLVNGLLIHRTESVPDANALKSLPNEVARKAYLLAIERRNTASHAFNNNGNILSMIALPLYTLFTWGFFKKRGYNFAEHLTANFYFISFANLFFTFLFTPFMGITVGTSYYYLFLVSGMLAQVIYLAWAQFQFLKFRKKASFLKTFGVLLLANITWSALTILGFILYVSRGNFFSAVQRMFHR